MIKTKAAKLPEQPLSREDRQKAYRFAILYGQALPAQGFALPQQPAIQAALEENSLKGEALRPVHRLMQELDHGGQSSPLCYEVLRASFRAVRLIDNCLRFDETGRSSRYLKDLRRQVVEDHWLSQAQVARLDTAFHRMDPRLPRLDLDSFARARPYRHTTEPF